MPINACGLQAAESNRAVLRYIKEDDDCWGVTPATGVTREMRITQSSLTANKETTVSNELRADRMVPDVIETSRSSGGDVSVEFSAGSLDDFMQAFLLGLWTRSMTFDKFSGTAVSIENGASTIVHIAGGDYTAYFAVGQRVKTEGFLTTANNDYWQIASLAFASGTTSLTMTTDTGATEASSAYSTVMDANDVVILKNTAIRAGTAGANSFDSNGGNAFAAAIAAGQLIVGQKIVVDFKPAYETGTFEFTAAGTDGDTLTINDGVNTVTFELDDDSSFARGNVGVTIGGSAALTAEAFRAQVMDQLRKKKIRASATLATATVTIRNLEKDQIANAATTALSDASTAVTTVSFASGVAAFGTFTVTALDDDEITVAEDVGTHANGGTAAISIKGSHLRNPGDLADIIAQSFSVETGFTDKGLYFLQTGLRVGSFNIAVSAGELVNGKIAFMGKETTVDDASVLGNSPYDVLATTATPILNATVNVGDVYKNGELLATALQSIELNGEAALREQKAVGSTFPAGIGTGRFNLTGKMTSYFETLEMYDHFLAHDTISLAFDFLDADKNVYWFTVPALKITTDPIAPGGIDQDVLEEMEFVALRDPNLNTQFMVDRFSSTTPATA